MKCSKHCDDAVHNRLEYGHAHLVQVLLELAEFRKHVVITCKAHFDGDHVDERAHSLTDVGVGDVDG